MVGLAGGWRKALQAALDRREGFAASLPRNSSLPTPFVRIVLAIAMKSVYHR